MNELELTVFTYSIEKIGWQFPGSLIDSRLFLVDLSPYASYTKIGLDSLHLHLCCLGFMVKQKLNEKKDWELIHFYLEKKVYSSFTELYKAWSAQHKSQFNVEPIGLNRIFNKLSFVNWNGSSDKVDYNALVDAIIDISPPYSGKDDTALGKEEDGSRKRAQNQKNLKPAEKTKMKEIISENEEESLLKHRQHPSDAMNNVGPKKKKSQTEEMKFEKTKKQAKKNPIDSSYGIFS